MSGIPSLFHFYFISDFVTLFEGGQHVPEVARGGGWAGGGSEVQATLKWSQNGRVPFLKVSGDLLLNSRPLKITRGPTVKIRAQHFTKTVTQITEKIEIPFSIWNSTFFLLLFFHQVLGFGAPCQPPKCVLGFISRSSKTKLSDLT